MAALRFAGLGRNRNREDRDAGAAQRRARRPGVEALERRRLLSLAALPPIEEFPISTPAAGPHEITTGPDGALWFTEYAGNKIGRITAGSLTDYSGLSPSSAPVGIAAGPDGNLWFTEVGNPLVPGSGNKIGQINPTTHVVSEYGGLTASSGPTGITAGPDGALWFTESGVDKIGRITTSGNVTEYGGLTAGSNPAGIAVGPDGNLWFTENGSSKIGEINPTTHLVTEFPVPHRIGPTWLDRGGARRRTLVHRVRREPDRPHHDRRQSHRVPLAHRIERSLWDRSGARRRTLVHGEQRGEGRSDYSRRHSDRALCPHRTGLSHGHYIRPGPQPLVQREQRQQDRPGRPGGLSNGRYPDSGIF
jgi:sugar lactone lactonase YvrE